MADTSQAAERVHKLLDQVLSEVGSAFTHTVHASRLVNVQRLVATLRDNVDQLQQDELSTVDYIEQLMKQYNDRRVRPGFTVMPEHSERLLTAELDRRGMA